MKFLLTLIVALFPILLFGQARKGVYQSEGYFVLTYNDSVGNYIVAGINEDNITITLKKETIKVEGAVNIKEEIAYSGVTMDDEAFIYYTPSSKVVIQRELNYWVLFYGLNEDQIYTTMVYIDQPVFVSKNSDMGQLMQQR